MSGIQGNFGKYVEKFKGGTERVSARIPIIQLEKLKLLLLPGETISDKVREAIASYLKHNNV